MSSTPPGSPLMPSRPGALLPPATPDPVAAVEAAIGAPRAVPFDEGRNGARLSSPASRSGLRPSSPLADCGQSQRDDRPTRSDEGGSTPPARSIPVAFPLVITSSPCLSATNERTFAVAELMARANRESGDTRRALAAAARAIADGQHVPPLPTSRLPIGCGRGARVR